MALTPAETELKLLSSIVDPQDLTVLLREGVSEETFMVYGAVFAYLLDYTRQYDRQLPSRRDLEAVFKDEELQLVEPGKLQFYVDELRKQDLVRRAQHAILDRFGREGAQLLENPDETVRLLAEDLRGFQRHQTQRVALLDRDALIRLGWLRERIQAAQEKRVLGIPTGLRIFDEQLQGWQPGEAIMVMGAKGVGKSFLTMYFACVAYQHGVKVLYLSPEMGWEECALRFDVVLARLAQQELSLTGLTTGRAADVDRYQVWLESLCQREAFVCIDSADTSTGAFTLPSMLALQDEYRPDLMVVDGIHLVGGEDRVSGWERIKRAADGLKAAAQYYKSVVIWSSQVDREAMRAPTEPAASGASAAYGKAAVEAANRLITLAAYAGDSRRRVFKVPNNRGGREYHTKQHLLFDVDIGRIEQLDVDLPQDFVSDGEMRI